MRRYNFHWLVRWALRVAYGSVIVFLVFYIGIGYFLRGRLASELLVKQLSKRLGRPVKVKMVSMDWFHGFHVVLEDVVILGEAGESPWLTCKRFVATVEIWPFLSKKEIVFRHLSVEEGKTRLVRTEKGEWRGVIPVVPVSTERRKRGRGDKRKFLRKQRITVFFPHVTLRRISAEIAFERKGEKRCVHVYLEKGKADAQKGIMRGELAGNFRLCEKRSKTHFHSNFRLGLGPDNPFRATLSISGLSFGELRGFLDPSLSWRWDGKSDGDFELEGSLKKGLRFRGILEVRDLLAAAGIWHVSVGRVPLRFQIQGGYTGKGKTQPTSFVKLEGKGFPLRVERRLENGTRLLRAVIGGFSFQGTYQLQEKRGELSLTLRSSSAKAKREALVVRSTFWLGSETSYEVAFTCRDFPLQEVLSFFRGKTEPLVSEKKTTLTLSTLSVMKGKIVGGRSSKVSSIQSAFLSVEQKDFGARIHVSPFSLPDGRPIRFVVDGYRIPATLFKNVPRLLERMPPAYRIWCQAMEQGLFETVKGEVFVDRDGKGNVKKWRLHRLELKGANLTVVAPEKGVEVSRLSFEMTYLSPSLRISRLHCLVGGESRIRMEDVSISDIRARPLNIKGRGEFLAVGLDLRSKVFSSPFFSQIASELRRRYLVLPEYLEGKIKIRFEGTLFPFSYKTYDAALEDVRLKMLMEARGFLPSMPATLSVTAHLQPRSVKISKASLLTPLGGMIFEDAFINGFPDRFVVDGAVRGELKVEGKGLSSRLPVLKSLGVFGSLPFMLKVKGEWPRLFLQGHLSLTDVSVGYKNFFRKDKGVKASLDFHLDQTGEHSCKVSWLRGRVGEFVVKMWGNLAFLPLLKGKLYCQTDTKEFSALLPLFPFLCNDRQCRLAEGDIQCDGFIELGKEVSYRIEGELTKIQLPLPRATDSLLISRVSVIVGDKERVVDAHDIHFRKSVGNRLLFTAASREGQWFWKVMANFDFLDLDDFRWMVGPGEGKEKQVDGSEEKKEGPFVRFVHFLSGKYLQTTVSAKGMKVVDYQLQDFFMKLDHQGTHGGIRGLNFLTPEGYGAIDVDWAEMDKGNILLKVRPIAKRLDFGKILKGVLRKDSPFTGWLSFQGELKGIGKSFRDVKRNLSGYLDVEYRDGVIKRWRVLSDIFALINIYDILKGFPDITKEGLAYRKIKGTIRVQRGMAKTDDAHLESRPFYIGGQGTLNLGNGMLDLVVGVYPFKVIDKIISNVPIVGWVFTDENKKVLGYYFSIKGFVTHPKVTSVNLESYGKNIFNIFKKIITLPIYPFVDHSKGEEKK